MDKLHLMSDALMKYETIDRKQIDEIMQGHEPGPPDSWNDSDPSGNGGNGPNAGAGNTDAKADDSDRDDSSDAVPSPAHNRQS